MSEAIALAFEEREYTLSELDALASGMATTLEDRGVRPGDRVALMSSNRPEFVVALRAIWRLGASAVLLSPAWKRTEVEHALALTKPGYAVGDHPVLAESMPMLRLDERDNTGQSELRSAGAGLRRAVRLQLGHHRDAQGSAPHARLVRGRRCSTGATRWTCRRRTACRS